MTSNDGLVRRAGLECEEWNGGYVASVHHNGDDACASAGGRHCHSYCRAIRGKGAEVLD